MFLLLTENVRELFTTLTSTPITEMKLLEVELQASTPEPRKSMIDCENKDDVMM